MLVRYGDEYRWCDADYRIRIRDEEEGVEHSS
jgi:hypothetical protein